MGGSSDRESMNYFSCCFCGQKRSAANRKPLPHASPTLYTTRRSPDPAGKSEEQPERAAAATRTSQTPTTPARKEPQRQEPRREAHPTRRQTRQPPLKPQPGRKQRPPTTHTRSNKRKQTAAAAAAVREAGRAHGRALPDQHNTQHAHMPHAHENTRRAESSLAPQRSRALGKPNQ